MKYLALMLLLILLPSCILWDRKVDLEFRDESGQPIAGVRAYMVKDFSPLEPPGIETLYTGVISAPGVSSDSLRAKEFSAVSDANGKLEAKVRLYYSSRYELLLHHPDYHLTLTSRRPDNHQITLLKKNDYPVVARDNSETPISYWGQTVMSSPLYNITISNGKKSYQVIDFADTSINKQTLFIRTPQELKDKKFYDQDGNYPLYVPEPKK